jgi:hypothetical protein
MWAFCARASSWIEGQNRPTANDPKVHEGNLGRRRFAGAGGRGMRTIFGWMLTAVAVLALSGVSTPQSAEKSDDASVKEKLIGAWRLAWEEEQGTDGKMKHIVDHKGTIVYTLDGHMSVQIMLPSTDGLRDVDNPVKYDQGGYEAYYGSYQVDEQAHTVTHHVQGSLVRALVGKDLTRVYRFSDGKLILKSSRPDEHWTIAWERY